MSEMTGSRPALRPSREPTDEFVTDHDDSPQAVTYMEALLEGANPDEGFYE